MAPAHVLLWLSGAYAITGFIAGIVFVSAGVGRIDPTARGAGIGFRLIILPGSAALWPIVLAKWISQPRTMP